MRYKFIKHIGIKYFPSNFLDYLSYGVFNFLFALVFIINIPFLHDIFFKSNKNSYILLIPKITNSFEEKKDLIFSGLSLNTNIVSVREIEKKILLKKLNKNINPELVQEDLIPEIFEIIIKKNKRLILEQENQKLTNILEGAEILEKEKDSKDSYLKNILFLGVSLFMFISILIILQVDYVKKIKNFLEKSRIFGLKDSDIIYNISIGYFLFQILGVFLGYFFIFFFENNYNITSIFLNEYLESFIIFILIQNIICFFILAFILKHSLRKVF